MSYATQKQDASQLLALKELEVYLRLAEKGDMGGMMAKMDLDISPLGADYYKQHPNAVLLEAIIMLLAVRQSTGKSMAELARRSLEQWSRRRASPLGLFLPDGRLM